MSIFICCSSMVSTWTVRVHPQGLPGIEEPFNGGAGQATCFSLHAGVATKANQRDKLERLCRYITRPAVSEKRLSLTNQGKVRYELKTPYRDGTTHVIFEPVRNSEGHCLHRRPGDHQEDPDVPGRKIIDASRAPVAGQSSAAAVQPVWLIQGSIPAQPMSMLLYCADATGSRLAWRHELAGERVNDRNPFRSARRVRQDFGMIRLESSGSDCSMGMSFRGKGVNPSYTRVLY
jgi:hypothetical protein